MLDPNESDDVLQPIALDAAGKDATPLSSGRWMLGGLLVVVLAGWSIGLLFVFGPWADGGSSSKEPETELASVEEVVVPPPATPTVESATERESPAPVVSISIKTTPAGASVVINGTFRGSTPLMLSEWTAGESVQIRKAGYQSENIQLPPLSENKEMVVELTADSAPIRLRGDLKTARVFLQGSPIELPSDQRVQIPFSGAEIRIEKAGYTPWIKQVTPARSYQREVLVEFTPVASQRVSATPQPQVSGQKVIVLEKMKGLEMILADVPLEIEIGAPRGTPGRKSHEGVRRIRLERPFRMSKTEITNAQFALFDPSHSSGRYGTIPLSADPLPVVGVTWEQAVQFCNWLSEQQGYPPAYRKEGGQWAFEPDPGTGYRLPTEAEWEALLRKGSGSSLYAWGETLPPARGSLNIAGKESEPKIRTTLSGFEDPWIGPAPVQEAAETANGFRGLAGNVREWVHDGFTAPLPSQKVKIDPMESSEARFHVIKGAGWQDGSWTDLGMARRRYDERGEADIGFRIARYLEKSEVSP